MQKKKSDLVFFGVLGVVGLIAAVLILPRTPLGPMLGGIFGGGPAKSVSSMVKVDTTQPMTEETMPLDKQEVHTPEQFIAATREVREMPGGDVDLAYAMRIPKDYTAVNLSTGNNEQSAAMNRRLLGVIAKYNGPVLVGRQRASIDILALEMEHEIEAKYWLRHYIVQNGFTVTGDVESEDDRTAYAKFIDLPSGTYEAMHNVMLARISGKTIVIVRVRMPISLRYEQSYLQEQIAHSFHLQNKREGTIEGTRNFTLIDTARFNYPESWNINRPDFKDANRLSVTIANVDSNRKINGYINVLAVRRTPDTTIKGELGKLRLQMKDSLDIDVKELVSSTDLSYNARFNFQRLEVYVVNSYKTKLLDQELRLAVFGDRNWYIFVYLVTPSQDSDLYLWARNIRSYDLLLRSIR